jgi:hypothetical protein
VLLAQQVLLHLAHGLPMALRGRSATMNTCLGTLKFAMRVFSAATICAPSSVAPALGTTTAITPSPKSRWGRPTTALSATPGISLIRPSISAG